MKKPHIIPQLVGVMYAGGSGSRLWPVSTREHPKQINPIFVGKNLVVESYRRTRLFLPREHIVMVVTAELYKKIFPLIDLPKQQYIIQPHNTDTASAFALTAVVLETVYPGATAVTIYTDHLIFNTKHYISAITEAARVAEREHTLVTIGTPPTYPNTHFGYIKLQKKIKHHHYIAETFIEKPNLAAATSFVEDGGYVWNTGLYVWEPTTVLKLFKRYAPQFYEALITLRCSILTPSFFKDVSLWYDSVEKTSFDKKISEQLSELHVVVADYHWQDIGNWEVIYELAKKDAQHHAFLGKKPKKFASINSSGCLVLSPKKTIALVGVHDLAIIETDDTLLITTRSQAAAVKKAAQKFDH